MYLSEIAPVNLRGAIGTVYQLVVTISILICWPILLALTALPAVFQLSLTAICPESPKYLLINKDEAISAQRAKLTTHSLSLSPFCSTQLGSATQATCKRKMGEIGTRQRRPSLAAHVFPCAKSRTNPTPAHPLVISMMMRSAQPTLGINVSSSSPPKLPGSRPERRGRPERHHRLGTMNVLMTICSLVMVEKVRPQDPHAGRPLRHAVDVLLLFIPPAQGLRFLDQLPVHLPRHLLRGDVRRRARIHPLVPRDELFAQNARPVASSIAVAVNGPPPSSSASVPPHPGGEFGGTWRAPCEIWGTLFLSLVKEETYSLGYRPYVFLIFVILLSLFILFTWKEGSRKRRPLHDEITAMFKQSAYGGKQRVRRTAQLPSFPGRTEK
ncbi:Solute carrier family 2, facilitated glucose transporter member 1 [Penaeus vannamei]|uniref:Solute carrier family 2, facilitated glucose transporter member 1 n=1 Tax=Penaeus vannamei TaxID=6689 RepID=A0A3R7MJC8_PENVA|nr:Solute carrier family 2, facilitated glucose transporter member 1 [Penaeus vannamei]